MPKVLQEGLALNRYIDHTLVAPTAMDTAFESFLDEALLYNFKTVCVSPYIAASVVKALKPYPLVSTATVVAFPDGNIPLDLKIKEAEYYIELGVQEIDWVLHYGEVLNDNWGAVELEIVKMGETCAQGGVVSKCIVETPILQTTYMRQRVFEIVSNSSKVDFIKSATGRSYRGTGVEEIAFWDQLRGDNTRPLIKAAGLIKTAEMALDLIKAGADRLGISASTGVMEQYLESSNTFAEGRETAEEVPEERVRLVSAQES